MTKFSDLRVSDHYVALFEYCMSVFSLLLLVELLAIFGAPVVSNQFVRVVLSRFYLGFSLRWVLLFFGGAAFVLMFRIGDEPLSRPLLVVLLGGVFIVVLPSWMGLGVFMILFGYVVVSYRNRMNLGNRFVHVLLFLELISLVHWSSQFIARNSVFQPIAVVEDQLYGFTSVFAPIFSIVFLLVGLLPLILEDQTDTTRSQAKWGLPISPRKLFVISILFAVLLPLIPYSPGVNPNLDPTSPDVNLLVEWIEEASADISSIFSISEGSRIGFLLSTLLFKSLFGLSSFKAVLFFPCVVFPLFVASVYYLTVKGTQDQRLASLSAFFTVFGFILIEGMYVYFISNIQFLTLFAASLGMMFEFQQTRSRKSLIASTLLFVVSLYFHPWAFGQMFLSLCLYFVFEVRAAVRTRVVTPALDGIAVLLLCGGFVNFVFGQIFGVGGVSVFSSLIQFKPWELVLGHIQAVNFIYHGSLGNSLIFVVSIAGVLLMDRKDSFSRAMIAILVTVSLGYLFLDPFTKNRALVNIFYGVFSGYAGSFLLTSNRHPLFYFYSVSVMVYVFKNLFFLI